MTISEAFNNGLNLARKELPLIKASDIQLIATETVFNRMCTPAIVADSRFPTEGPQWVCRTIIQAYASAM